MMERVPCDTCSSLSEYMSESVPSRPTQHLSPLAASPLMSHDYALSFTLTRDLGATGMSRGILEREEDASFRTRGLTIATPTSSASYGYSYYPSSSTPQPDR